MLYIRKVSFLCFFFNLLFNSVTPYSRTTAMYLSRWYRDVHFLKELWGEPCVTVTKARVTLDLSEYLVMG